MPRLLIVDDHLIVRDGLKRLINGTPDSAMTAETCSSQDAIKLIRGNGHDVVLLGITLSDVGPIELLKQVKADKPKLPVLILSASNEEQYCKRLLKAGASGILLNQSAATELVDAVTKLSHGRRYISPSVAEKLTDLSTDGSAQSLDILSDREYEVMTAIASGKRMKQIAEEMSLSVKTVSTYHSRILEKLNFNNDAQLIRYGIEQGLIRNGVVAREKLILTELSLKTSSVVGVIKQIWQVRKAVIIVVGVLAIIGWIALGIMWKFVWSVAD